MIRSLAHFKQLPSIKFRPNPNYFVPSKQQMATSTTPSYKKYETRTKLPNPKTSVLLVLDMQTHYSPLAKPILPNLLTTIDLCRRASVPIIFTRHLDNPNSDYRILAEWWHGERIIDGNPDAELLPDIKALVGENELVEKNTYSAFVNTRLKERLVEMGVEEVIVTGVMTNLACETTARDAFTRGFTVFFSTDATNTADVEMQESSLKNLAFGFAYLVDCERLKHGLLKE